MAALLASAVACGEERDERRGNEPLGETQEAVKVKTETPVLTDQFGQSVALSGSLALVGAPLDEAPPPPTNTDSGSAYPFDLPTASPLATVALTVRASVDDANLGDELARSVSLSGERALIGAPGDTADQGAAYVFERSGGMWLLRQKLVAPGGVANDAVGTAVSVAGDRALVGAPADDGTGSAFVFERQESGMWVVAPANAMTTPLLASDRVSGDAFGRALALSGDFAIVGAPLRDGTTVANVGVAYIFERQGDGTWLERPRLEPVSAADRTANAQFGSSVAIENGLAVIGAPGALQGGAGSIATGAVYVFARDQSGNWAQVQRISPVASTGVTVASGDAFGTSVSLSGTRLFVGASSDNQTASNAGAAYLYRSNAMGSWEFSEKFRPTEVVTNQAFGTAVAVSGSFVLAGAPGDNVGAIGSGAAHWFDIGGGQGDPCTTAEECSTGFCVDGVCCESACDAGFGAARCRACSVAEGSTADGTCSPVSGSCDDANACTEDDACMAGVCVGDEVVCTPQDQCHDAGVCDPETGMCSNPEKPNGTTCDDMNACTGSSTCQMGVCTGMDDVVCTPQDQCHDAGVCDPETGMCSNPEKPNGTTCDDMNACTGSSTCQMGVCTGMDPVMCPTPDQCHDPGMCDPETGMCTNPPKPNGTTCNDMDACTQTDTCQMGTCVGMNPVVCMAQDQCHVAGMCNPATGMCTNPNAPNGTPCSDMNACTQTDTCQMGSCVGMNPVVCPTPDQCHDPGMCLPATGTCTNPAKPNGTACTDGNACTQLDTCQAGSCAPGAPVVCTALDQCHDPGVCNTGTGVCSNPNKPNGTACNDGQSCTTPDTCTNGVCSGPASAVFTLASQSFANACRQAETIPVASATATACGQAQTVTGQVIATDGVTLAPPVNVTGGNAQLGVGSHTVRWTATQPGTGTVTGTTNQTRFVGSVVQARESFTLGARARLRDNLNDVDGVPAGTFQGRAILLNSGIGAATLNEDARAGGIRSLGAAGGATDVVLLDRAIIQGNVVTQGTISVGTNVTITGTQSPNTAVVLPNFSALPTFPSFAAGITINSGSQNIAPGAYQFLNVAAGATAILTASGTTTGGQYFFQNISINGFIRAAQVVIPTTGASAGQPTGGTRIYVQNSFTLLNSIRPLGFGTTVQTSFLGLATTGSATLQVPFNGTVLAPNAALTLGTGAGLDFIGSFYARALTITPDSDVMCSRPSALVTTAAPGVSASLTVTNDWGTGYCAQLFVTNIGGQATTNWWLSLDTNQSTIYDHWNGNFSGSSGIINIAPSFSWNQVIQPAATDESIGFCTNRNTQASTVASVVAAWGSY